MNVLKAFKVILVFIMLIPFLSMDLKAEKVEKKSKLSGTAFSAGISYFIQEEDNWIAGVDLNIDLRIARELSIGLDVVFGADADGEAMTSLSPTISYHIKTKSKKNDFFAGIGINAITTYDPPYSNDHESAFFGFLGTRLLISKHFGCTFRAFITRAGFGGGSICLSYIE